MNMKTVSSNFLQRIERFPREIYIRFLTSRCLFDSITNYKTFRTPSFKKILSLVLSQKKIICNVLV